MHIEGQSRSVRSGNRAQPRTVLHVNTTNAGFDKHKCDTTPVSKQEALPIILDANANEETITGKRGGYNSG